MSLKGDRQKKLLYKKVITNKIAFLLVFLGVVVGVDESVC